MDVVRSLNGRMYRVRRRVETRRPLWNLVALICTLLAWKENENDVSGRKVFLRRSLPSV